MSDQQGLHRYNMSNASKKKTVNGVNFEHFSTILFLSSNKMLVLDWSSEMLVRIAKRAHPDQTASSEAV